MYNALLPIILTIIAGLVGSYVLLVLHIQALTKYQYFLHQRDIWAQITYLKKQYPYLPVWYLAHYVIATLTLCVWALLV